MTQAQSKSYGGVKKKLMGAICMLLVASIMVVSSTYAWFTLSTAPEITGISTSVGANGNLEMALLSSDTFETLKIESAVGDSGKPVTEKNLTWGNLVGLSDESYGLGKIKLMPAALNINGAAGAFTVTKDNLLATPTYGTDGRVADLSGKTYTAKYDGTNWAFDKDNPGYGVRAIGSNDNLTPQQAGLLGAKSEYNQALSAAKTTIQNALSTNGKGLSNAVMALALDGGAEQLKEDQQAAINAMVEAAEKALTEIDKAYVALLKASVTSLDAAKYSAASGALADKATLAEAISALNALTDLQGESAVPTQLTALQNTLKTNKDAVSTAKSKCTAGDYQAALNALVDATKVKVNGFAKKDMITDGEANSDFVNAVVQAGGAVVEMPDGSGVFAYIGSVAGNYAAPTKVDINYKGLKLTDFPATMKTTATPEATAGALLQGITPSGDATGTDVSLSDTYGYALDMAFRTNAASSYLKLQTEAMQRVYSDSKNTDTQGGGSYMAFKSTTNAAGAPNLDDATITKLMKAIHVAFIDPDNGTIYSIATLDIIKRDGDFMKGALKLNDLTATEGAKPTFSLTARTDTDGTEAKLMDLEQNKAKKLTVIVYLDGPTVTNADVANAETSLEGTLNLQFSSSATLKPMENTALKNGTGTTGGGTVVGP